MGSFGKYLIGMVAGAALVGGGGLAIAGSGSAKWEPCKMSQPATGVTQLCELDGGMALSSGARTGATGSINGSNGRDGSASVTIVNGNGGENPGNGGGFNISFPGPGSFPSGGSQPNANETVPGGLSLPGTSLPAIALPDPNGIVGSLPSVSAPAGVMPNIPGLPSTSAPAGVLPGVPGLDVPTVPAVSIPGNLIPGGGSVPLTDPLSVLPATSLPSTSLPSTSLPTTNLPSLQVNGTATTPNGTQGASAVVGNPMSSTGISVNAGADTSSSLLGPHTPGGIIDSGTTLNVTANPAQTGGPTAAATVSADTSATNSSNPAVKVNATATGPGTTTGTNGLNVDVAANTGSEPGASASVSGDVGTGGSAATGVSASAEVSTSGAGATGVGVSGSASTGGSTGGIGIEVNGGSAASNGGATASVSSGGSNVASVGAGSGGITASTGTGGVSVGIGSGNIGIGTDPGGSASGSGAGGIASLALY